MNELSEKRASKFLNRALPDPPPSAPLPSSPTKTPNETCPEELDNLYELISHSTAEVDVLSAVDVSNTGEMYEDIDNCLERSDTVVTVDSWNGSSSSRQSTTSRSSSSVQRATHNPTDDEYLEPVIPPEEEVQHSSSWRPMPAPRASASAQSDTQQTSYVNAQMMSTGLPSVADGFVTMSNTCQAALRQIAERISTQYMNVSWPASCHLRWSDFTLSDDGQPVLSTQYICYYRARHAALAPKGCILMVRSLTYLLTYLPT